MDEKKFEAMLTLIVPKTVNLITENYPYDEITAYKEFYASKVYSLLEQEDNKILHFRTLNFFNMFEYEKISGYFTIQEEV